MRKCLVSASPPILGLCGSSNSGNVTPSVGAPAGKDAAPIPWQHSEPPTMMVGGSFPRSPVASDPQRPSVGVHPHWAWVAPLGVHESSTALASGGPGRRSLVEVEIFASGCRRAQAIGELPSRLLPVADMARSIALRKQWDQFLQSVSQRLRVLGVDDSVTV